MILIKPDHDRRIDIPGVPAPVRRPVDIDQTRTGFTHLRTLRIYRFDAGSVIEGHAEEDEVFIVVIAGSVELTMSEDSSPSTQAILSAPENAAGTACAAYLPPGGAYTLIARTEADVAYARATPSAARPPKVFSSSGGQAASGVTVQLEETAYAERLRIRLVQFDTRESSLVFAPIDGFEVTCEGLIHIRALRESGMAMVQSNQGPLVLLDPWDTVAIPPSDRLTLHLPKGSSGLALIVAAI